MNCRQCKVSAVWLLMTAICIFFSIGVMGDTTPSRDGYLHIGLARQALQHAVGKVELTPQEVLRLEQDWDGALSIADARILLQKVVGKWTPTPSTETVATLPDGERVDFRLLGQSRIKAVAGTDTYGLYVAKSYTDLAAILSKLYTGLEESAPDLKAYTGIDFTNQAVLVLHCVDGAGNTTQRVDSLLRVDGQLILSNTAVQDAHPTPDIGNRYVMVVIDIQDLKGIRSFAIYSQQQMVEQ